MPRLECTTVFKANWDAIHATNEDGSRKYKYIINIGSSRSSKTLSIIDCYDLYARANNDKRMTVWRDTKTDCRKTVLNDVLKRLKKTSRYKVNQEFNKTESIFTYATDSTFEIHGTDDEETVHGLTQDCAWLNEPYKISRETFDQIDQRTSDFVIIDMNPKKSHWCDDLTKDPRAIVINSTFKDNPFCPVEQKNKILSYQPISYAEVVATGLISLLDAKEYSITDNPNDFTEKQLKELSRCRENEFKNSANEFNWQVYGLGLKAERPNRIFNFKEIADDIYHNLNVKEYYAVDWGAVDPWGILACKYYDGALYFHELNYASENTIRAKLKPTELEQINNQDEGLVTWHFNKLSIDKKATIVCDPNRLEKIAALRRAGYAYAIAASKPAGSINFGIDTLNDMPVFFTKSSVNFKYEQENYSRKVDRYGIVMEEAEDLDNHLMDPARYIAFHLRRLGIIKKI
jgi:PBSX family phage terminase large subunit